MIEDLLTGRLEPGVYTWRTDRREAARGVTEVERAGRRVHWLDGTGVRDKSALLERCAEEFSLPSYFGRTWDALQDCLNDLSWAPAATGRLIVYEHWQELAEAAPEVHRTFTDVLETSVAYWRATATPMAVFLLA